MHLLITGQGPDRQTRGPVEQEWWGEKWGLEVKVSDVSSSLVMPGSSGAYRDQACSLKTFILGIPKCSGPHMLATVAIRDDQSRQRSIINRMLAHDERAPTISLRQPQG